MKVHYLPGQAHYFSERNDRENSRVALLGNELFLRNLSTPPDVGHFIRALNRLLGERHKKEINIYLEGDFSIYANIIVPVAPSSSGMATMMVLSTGRRPRPDSPH